MRIPLMMMATAVAIIAMVLKVDLTGRWHPCSKLI